MPEITKMKFTLESIYEKFEAIKKFGDIKDLPVKTAYRLGKLLKSVLAELKESEEIKSKLIEKYGEKEKSGYSKVKEENLKAYNDEWKEMLKEEIELSFIKVPLSDIPQGSLTSADIMYLEEFFTEDSIVKFMEDESMEKVKENA
jgi:hypothetical protein